MPDRTTRRVDDESVPWQVENDRSNATTSCGCWVLDELAAAPMLMVVLWLRKLQV